MINRLSVAGLAVVVAVLGMAPVATAKQGMERPFKADLVGEVTFEFPSDVCPGPLTLTESWGTASHMGHVEADWAHCPISADGFIFGGATVSAANGDELFFEYENLDGDNPFEMSVDGGSGRFAGATGWVFAAYEVTPVFLPPDACTPGEIPENPNCFDLVTPWPWSASMHGMISY